MTHQLRVVVAFPEDASLILRIKWILCPLLTFRGTRHTCVTHIYVNTKYVHK